MVSLSEIKNVMKLELKHGSEFHKVEVSGENIPGALKQASVELAIPINKIEYEIIEEGNYGVFGLHKKPYKILAYPATLDSQYSTLENSPQETDSQNKNVLQDGRVLVRREPAGIMMRVSPPENGGQRITEQQAIKALESRQVYNADVKLVSVLVKKADNFFVKVASFSHDPNQDSTLSINFQDMDMSAYITISPPGIQGADLSFDAIMGFLNANGVTFGILENKIAELTDNPIYYQSILIAKGRAAKNGKNGYVDYAFRRSQDKMNLQEIDGKVNFKELGRVNNVVKGQILATLIDPEEGIDGQTVTGRKLSANSGKRSRLNIGENVHISDDGHTAIADMDGQVVFHNDKLTIEPVYIVNNGVNLKTGNILFLGTVQVSGNVEDGFSIKASGNIDITGSVGKSELDCEGDIIISQGINGREGGKITAGGNIYAKFIQNTEVFAGGMVIVSDGIINSHVSSDQKIICKGRRANIVGGVLHAAEEIRATTIGSIANVETVLVVGFDPKSKEKLDELVKEEETIKAEFTMKNKNLEILKRSLRTNKSLPKERLEQYKELKETVDGFKQRLNTIASERETITKYLNGLKSTGKISAKLFHPGVKLSIKNATQLLSNEERNKTFLNEGSILRIIKFDESDGNLSVGRPFRRY